MSSVKMANSNSNVFWVLKNLCYLDLSVASVFRYYPNVSISVLTAKVALCLQLQIVLASGT